MRISCTNKEYIDEYLEKVKECRNHQMKLLQV